MKPAGFRFGIVLFSAVMFFIPTIVLAEETATSTPEEIPSAEIVSSTPAIAVDLRVRYQDTFVFSDTVTTTLRETLPDSLGVVHSLSASSSVLTALTDADAISDQFSITDLQYYDSGSSQSFYLKCLTVTTSSTASSTLACDNWSYVVNGVYPSVGMDSYPLLGGETVYVYFGNSWNITASTSTFPLGTTTTLSTWRYNYGDLESEWLPDENDTVDISIPNLNPTGWWDATITTSTLLTNASGTVDYVFTATGTYYAKIAPSDYSKWSPAITLQVLDAPVMATSTATSTPAGGDGSNGGGSGGGGGSSAPITVSAAVIEQKAQALTNFLKSQQDNEGKIVDAGTTDWAIMSLATRGEYAEDIKKGIASLLDYAKGYNFTDASDLNVCASYPRHVLALLAGGVSANDSLIQTLTAKIKSNECYQNNLYGQNGINDDVFALFSLLAVDIAPTEPIIMDIVSSTLKDQTVEGSFTWAGYASPDITGAAINALRYAVNKGAVVSVDIFTKAKDYLKAQQLADGGWGFGTSDALTTSWAMMGINALGEGQADWTNSQSKNPWTILTEQLNSNGYYEPSLAPGTVEWFGTKHAVPALLGKTWPLILTPRPAPAIIVSIPTGGVGGISSNDFGVGGEAFLPTTSTLAVVTSTPIIITTSTVQNLNFDTTSSTISVMEDSVEKEDASAVSVSPAISTAVKAASVIKKVETFEPILTEQVLEDPKSVESEKTAGTVFKKAPAMTPDPVLPLKKKVATTAAAASAMVFSSTSILLLIRLLLAAL